jgi:hypothetical protein
LTESRPPGLGESKPFDREPRTCRDRANLDGCFDGSHKKERFVSMEMAKYRWTQVSAEAAFAPRDGAGALVFDGQMWLLGGWNPRDKAHFPKICNSEVWRSRDGAHWSLAATAPWEGRHTAGYVVHDDKMWVVGGDAIRGHYQPDVWSTRDGVHWTQATGAAPWGERVLHCTVAHDGGIWVMGGQTTPQFAPAEERFFNDIWNTTDGVNWMRVTQHAPWSPRGMIGGIACFGGRIWLLGGGTYDTPDHPTRLLYNEVWSSADGVNWRRDLAQAPWIPRQYHDIAVFDNRMWVLEGCNGKGTNFKDVWYSEDGGNWNELSDTPWAPRHAAGVYVYENALWVVAGNNMQSDVWRLDKVGIPKAGSMDEKKSAG